MGVSLDDAKAHLRVDGPYDDETIATYVAAAEGHLAGTGVDMSADPLPAAVTAAVLLTVGHLFENREATAYGTVKEVPFGVDRLVAPYREAVA